MASGAAAEWDEFTTSPRGDLQCNVLGICPASMSKRQLARSARELNGKLDLGKHEH